MTAASVRMSSFLIENLCSLKKYARQGAREVCLYVIDNARLPAAGV
jgi:hypothetical protein